MIIDLFVKRSPSVEFWILLVAFSVGLVSMSISYFWFKISKPLKVKIDELTCWHIERPEPEHHAWSHCYDYNFEGDWLITPRIEAVATNVYLDLLVEKVSVKIDYVRHSPEGDFFKFITGKKISGVCTFSIRLPKEIKVPSYGYVVIEFERGKTKKKVSIILNDEYRPNFERNG